MDPIKKQSVVLKVLFFLFFVCWGISTPYFGIFYKHILVRPDGTPAIDLIGLIFFLGLLWLAGSTHTIYFDDAPRVEAAQ